MELAELETVVQAGWTLFAAALVLLMQAGFCCLEAGSVRHKNSINVSLKNIVDLSVSILAFFVVGYSLMFGASQSGWIGMPVAMLRDQDNAGILFFLFQATFCGTAATIVSGGIAERARFLPYVLVSLVVGLLIYPIFGHWVWGGGWLAQMGYKDFAGSSVVHMLGAGVALAGIQVLGARRGRFDEDGNSTPLPASSMPMVAIGVIILTFGWIGFNGGSAALGASTAIIVTNTILAACVGGVAALLGVWAYGGLARPDLVLNGVLGGLVAITAGADVVSLPAATIIGAAGGFAVVIGTWLMEKCRLDDAVGAVPVHGVAGLVGIIITAVFASPETIAALNGDRVGNGYEEMSRAGFIGVQAIGGFSCLIWAYVTGLLLWLTIKFIMPIRIGEHEEMVGLNYSEHRVASPFEELATALVEIGKGDSDTALERLDHAGDGELARITAGIREQIIRQEAHFRWMRQQELRLDELTRDLTAHQNTGLQQLDRNRQVLEDCERRLRNLDTMLADQQLTAASLPVVGDGVRTLANLVKQLAQQIPHNSTNWQAIGRSSQQLETMLRAWRKGAGA